MAKINNNTKIGDDLLPDAEFLEWAAKRVHDIHELIIASHTPIIFFNEERIGSGLKYHTALSNRFLQDINKTTYFVSEQELNKRIFQNRSYEDKINNLKEWRKIIKTKKNVKLFVVKDGFFIVNSLWISIDNDLNKECFIKLRYENERFSQWLKISGNLSWLNKIINLFYKESIDFDQFLTLEIDHQERIADLNFP